MQQELYIPLFRCERYDQPQLGDRNFDEYSYERWTWQELGVHPSPPSVCFVFDVPEVGHAQAEVMSQRMVRLKAMLHWTTSSLLPPLLSES